MTRDLFLISSAINTEYGAFTSQEKLNQLFDTIQSVRQHHTGATDIMVIDCSPDSLTQEQMQDLSSLTNDISVFTCTESMRINYWDGRPDQLIYKTVGELCIWQYFFHITLSLNCAYGRVFKLSGRYQLNDTFSVEKHQFQGLVMKPFRKWPLSKTLPNVFVNVVSSRLWSFPWFMMSEMNECWYRIIRDFENHAHTHKEIMMIERLLYQGISSMQLPVRYLDTIGVQGHFGQDGKFIQE